MQNKILLGTGNQGKLKEFHYYINHFQLFKNYTILNLKDFILSIEPDENGNNFDENSKIKSIFYFQNLNLKTLSDDSGFIVNNFNNFPGIKTARAGKEMGGEQKVIDYIYNQLNKDIIEAIFYCSLSLIGEGPPVTVLGQVKGTILPSPKGKNGFGYDPYFIPENNTKTFAEMSSEEKMLCSHRYDAFKKLSNQTL